MYDKKDQRARGAVLKNKERLQLSRPELDDSGVLVYCCASNSFHYSVSIFYRIGNEARNILQAGN